MIRSTAALLLLIGFASAAAAHPLPNTRYDRIVAVRLGPETITVRYTLEVTLFTISLDAAKLLTPEEIAQLGRSTRDLEAAYAKKIAPEIARDLRAAVDGQPLNFHVTSIDTESGEHPKFVFVFTADWPPGGTTRKFDFIDESFDGKPGILNLTLDRADLRSGVSLDDLVEPDPVWRTKPAIDLTPEEAAGLRKASAVVTLPHDIAAAKPASAAEPTVTVTESGERPSLAADLWHRGLPALFDSNAGIGALLLAALLFGAAHAFTPGHGKTLVAAYLVGERGTVWHAIILAIATTVAHTGSVLVVAVVLWSAYGNDVPGATQGVLNFLGGLLVAAVGAWLLMRRLMGRADHFHLFAGHHHHHHSGDRRQETGDRRQETGDRRQGTGNRRQGREGTHLRAASVPSVLCVPSPRSRPFPRASSPSWRRPPSPSPPPRPAAGECEDHSGVGAALAHGPRRRLDSVLGRGPASAGGDRDEPRRLRDPAARGLQCRTRRGSRSSRRQRRLCAPGRGDAIPGEPVVPHAADGERRAPAGAGTVAVSGRLAGRDEVV
jgi:hypothetical protein